MKFWRVLESKLHEFCGASSGCVEVVLRSDAKAEIEKARREIAERGMGALGAELAKARAEERERIVKALCEWRSDGRERHGSYVLALSDIISWIQGHPSKPPEPKPLERLNLDEVYDPDIAKKVNELVDAVKDIQAWIAGQST